MKRCLKRQKDYSLLKDAEDPKLKNYFSILWPISFLSKIACLPLIFKSKQCNFEHSFLNWTHCLFQHSGSSASRKGRVCVCVCVCVCIFPMGWNTSHKKWNLAIVTRQMDLEDIMVNKSDKGRHHVISLICGI